MTIRANVIFGKCNFGFLNGYPITYIFFQLCGLYLKIYSYAARLRNSKVPSRMLKLYIPKNTRLTNCSLLRTLT